MKDENVKDENVKVPANKGLESIYVSKEVKQALKILAIRENTTIASIMNDIANKDERISKFLF